MDIKYCLCFVLICSNVSSLIYPEKLGVLQFLCGFGTAVDNLELENVLTGAIFRMNYPLPISPQNLSIIAERSINDRDTENTRKCLNDNFLLYRWVFYKAIEYLIENHGYDGKACLLRSICETAETPFHHGNGLLAELLHIILTPSSSYDVSSNDGRYFDYMAAEYWGNSGANCSVLYSECMRSILEQFTIKAV